MSSSLSFHTLASPLIPISLSPQTLCLHKPLCLQVPLARVSAKWEVKENKRERKYSQLPAPHLSPLNRASLRSWSKMINYLNHLEMTGITINPLIQMYPFTMYFPQEYGLRNEAGVPTWLDNWSSSWLRRPS